MIKIAEITLVSMILFGSAGLVMAEDTPTPEAAIEKIFNQIPAQWWRGGWDQRKEIDSIVSKYPGRPDLYTKQILYYGDYYYANNDYGAAIECYQKLIDTYPNEKAASTAVRHLADLYSYRMSRPIDAERLYQEVIEKYPASKDTPPALVRLKQIRLDVLYDKARAYLEKGYDEEGLDLYYRLIEEYGPDTTIHWAAVARLDLYEYYKGNGHILQAHKELQHILDDYPNSPYVSQAKKYLNGPDVRQDTTIIDRYNFDRLFNQYRKSPARLEQTSGLSGAFLEDLRNAQTPEAAIRTTMKYAETGSVDLSRNFLTGLFIFEYDEEGDGLYLLKQVNRAARDNVFIASALGSLGFSIGGRSDEQKERQLLFIKQITPAPIAHYWLARLYVKYGDHPEAIKLFEPLLAASPDRNDISFYYAISLHETGKVSEALKRLDALSDTFVSGELGKWMRGNRDDRSYCNIGGSYEHRGNSDRAIRYYQAGSCHAELGSLYFRRGNYFDAAIQLEQTDWNNDWIKFRDAQLLLADCYERLGALGNAFEVISEASRGCTRDPTGNCVKIMARTVALKIKISSQADDGGQSFPGLMTRLDRPRFIFFKEIPLPAAAALPSTVELLDPNSPALQNLKRHRDIRFSARDKNRVLAISVSGHLDPRGEVSRGGYWANLSSDGGAQWTTPLYMGLAEGFPYVIGHESRRPSSKRRKDREAPPPAVAYSLRVAPFKNGLIQVEAQVREIDESTITFPPVGLQPKRVLYNIYLEYPIEALTRDSDKDGLTDLYEEKIASDPYSDDTDKDGISDSMDIQPLAPPPKNPSDADAVLGAALEQILFRGRRPNFQNQIPAGNPKPAFPIEEVLFIESARPLSIDSSFPMRVVCLPPNAVEMYRKKFGPTYRLRFREVIFNKDKTEAFLKYDFYWRGGSLRAHKVDGKWKIEVIDEWVT